MATRHLTRLSMAVALLTPATVVAPRAFATDLPARIQTVALLPPTGDNIDPALLRAARDLLQDHLERAGTYAVVEPVVAPPAPPAGAPAGLPPPSEEPTAADAAKLGASVGAELSIVLRLTHFGTQRGCGSRPTRRARRRASTGTASSSPAGRASWTWRSSVSSRRCRPASRRARAPSWTR
jgi:hypothetical protein